MVSRNTIVINHSFNVRRISSSHDSTKSNMKTQNQSSRRHYIAHRILISAINIWILLAIGWIACGVISLSLIKMTMNSDIITNHIYIELATWVALLFGIIMILLAIVGKLAHMYKLEPLEARKINAINIFKIFLFLASIIIIIEILLLGICGNMLLGSKSIYNLEKVFSYVFNIVFFANARMQMTKVNSSVFWKWMEQSCPPTMNQYSCQKYYDFSPGNCAADIELCNMQHGDGYACPYTICKHAIQTYASECFLYGMIGVAVFLILHISTVIAGYISLDELKLGKECEKTQKDRLQTFLTYHDFATPPITPTTSLRTTTKHAYPVVSHSADTMESSESWDIDVNYDDNDRDDEVFQDNFDNFDIRDSELNEEEEDEVNILVDSSSYNGAAADVPTPAARSTATCVLIVDRSNVSLSPNNMGAPPLEEDMFLPV